MARRLLLPFAGCVVAAAALGGCAQRLIRLGPPAPDFAQIPNLTSLPQGDERYDCGPEAVAAVLAYQGKPVAVKQISTQLFNPVLKGTIVAKIPDFLRDVGFEPAIRNGSLAHLRSAVDDRRPVIVMVRFQERALHFFVVVGYDDKRRMIAFLYYPGKAGPMWAYCRYQDFEGLWEGTDNFMLEIFPTEPSVQQAIRLEHQRRWAEAIQAYETLLRKDPRAAAAWIGIGNCRYMLKEPEAAAQAYRKALEFHPDDAQAKNNLAHVLWEGGKELSEALSLTTTAVDASRASIRRLESALEAAGPDATSRESLEWLLDRSRRHLASFLGTHGDILCAHKRFEEGGQAFLESHALLKDDKGRARRLRQAADAFRSAGREDKAKELEQLIPSDTR